MVNNKLRIHGEDFSLTSRKVGEVLRSLGLKTESLGHLGRGLKFTSGLNRKIHAVAQRLGIDRRSIATLSGLEYGAGGAPCALCEKFGLTGGLQFTERFPNIKNRPTEPRPPLCSAPGDE